MYTSCCRPFHMMLATGYIVHAVAETVWIFRRPTELICADGDISILCSVSRCHRKRCFCKIIKRIQPSSKWVADVVPYYPASIDELPGGLSTQQCVDASRKIALLYLWSSRFACANNENKSPGFPAADFGCGEESRAGFQRYPWSSSYTPKTSLRTSSWRTNGATQLLR